MNKKVRFGYGERTGTKTHAGGLGPGGLYPALVLNPITGISEFLQIMRTYTSGKNTPWHTFIIVQTVKTTGNATGLFAKNMLFISAWSASKL